MANQCPHCGATRRNVDDLRAHIAKDHPERYEPLPAPGNPEPAPGQPVVRVYLRVSTEEQTNLNQLMKVKLYLGLRGWPAFTIYEEKESGAKEDRPALSRLMLDLGRGDVVVITRADRLSRSLRHFVQVTDYIHGVGADIVATEQPLDTTSPMGRAFWQVLGVFAELERALIVQRTRDGMARARSQNKIIGRHPQDCGIAYPCPAGLDHSAKATAERRVRKGRGRDVKAPFGVQAPLAEGKGTLAEGA